MSKVALKLLLLAVAWCLLLQNLDGANRQTDAAEAGYQPRKTAMGPNGDQTGANAGDGTPVQPAGCEAHLQRLRASFIETRHCALKNNPCETAAQASTFLEVLKECQEACPPEELNQHGFTARIVRNMQWLESYSSQKCNPATP
jgi:hypothetical protein